MRLLNYTEAKGLMKDNKCFIKKLFKSTKCVTCGCEKEYHEEGRGICLSCNPGAESNKCGSYSGIVYEKVQDDKDSEI